MNTASFLVLLSIIFTLTSASPNCKAAPAAHRPKLTKRVSSAPVVIRDDDHLCDGFTDIGYEYGNQNNQSGITSDCDELAKSIKAFADVQGNFTDMCEWSSELELFSSEGNCSLWFKCPITTEGYKVTMGYGDITDVLKLATDGLGSSVAARNSSLLSVRASMSCQSLQATWIVTFNGSDPGMGSREVGPIEQLWKMTSNLSPSEELHQ